MDEAARFRLSPKKATHHREIAKWWLLIRLRAEIRLMSHSFILFRPRHPIRAFSSLSIGRINVRKYSMIVKYVKAPYGLRSSPNPDPCKSAASLGGQRWIGVATFSFAGS